MGYDTKFEGRFDFNRQLTNAEFALLNEFSRKPYYDSAIYPSIHCDWTPSLNGMHLQWNESEKFYNYIEWLDHIIEHLLIPRDLILNGEVTWQGQRAEDRGKIVVINNIISTLKGRIVYEVEDEGE